MANTETIASAKELAAYYMDVGIPSYVEGPPGVGKSEMWQQIAKERKMGFIDIRLAQLDPVDLRGLPKHDGNMTTWARPDFWPIPKRDGDKGIILFDELGDCGKAMQSAAYQIILDGRAGPHVIPDGWYRCAAGNSQKHKAGAQAMSTALANRFAWIYVEADHDCFLEYGNKVGLHHYVYGFIKTRPGLLHTMEGCTEKAFASPRGWMRVSKVCEAPHDLLYKLVRGIIGEGPAAEFMTVLKVMDLPDLDDVLHDPKKCRIPKEPASKYALSSMLARNMSRQNIDKIMAYIKRAEFGRDFEICCALDATKRDNELCDTKAWVDFANRNQDLSL